ncbi:MAG: hypothetical protein KKD39_03990, partial [Candidatus Altiarchaeota archaeon]|nr:hypothetical protein [Candidatus Altiarchaeota archaeon]
VSALVDGARKACLGSQNRFFVFKAKDLTYVVDTGEVDEGSDELKKSDPRVLVFDSSGIVYGRGIPLGVQKYDVSDASSVGVIGARDMASLKGLKPLPTGGLGSEKVDLDGVSLVLLMNRDMPSDGVWDLKPETLSLTKTEKIDSAAYLDVGGLGGQQKVALSSKLRDMGKRMAAVLDRTVTNLLPEKKAPEGESITTVLDDFTSLAETVRREGKRR